MAAHGGAVVVPYTPDADTLGLYHVDVSSGVWHDASTNERHLAAAPGAVSIDTSDLGPAFANGYQGGTGDVGAVQYTNDNWTFRGALTAEAWLKAGLSSNAVSPKLFTLYDKINGLVFEFVLRDMNIPSGSDVLMTPAIQYTESSTNALWVQDSAEYACALRVGQWYHVAYVLDLTKGLHGEVAVYVTPKGAVAPMLFDTISLSAGLYTGTSAKYWALDRSRDGAFVFDEFRISSKARAAMELATVGIQASWVSWGTSGTALIGKATNVVTGSKVYATPSLVSPVWVEATNGVWSGPVKGLYTFQHTASARPLFFAIGR